MAPKRSHLVDKAIQFCCEIATLFENRVTTRVPNFIVYAADCSKSATSHFDQDLYSLTCKVGKETAQNVFDFMKKKNLQDIENSDGREKRSIHYALNKFFDKKNETEKKKFLIRLSSLIPTYLMSHKTYVTFWKDKDIVCDELFFLKYIYELSMEMLRPILINFSVGKYKRLKLTPVTQYDRINYSMYKEKTIDKNSGNSSIVNDCQA